MKYIIFILILVGGFSAKAQIAVTRSSLNCMGNVIQQKNISLSQSAGQSSLTNSFDTKGLTLYQGFQQPYFTTSAEDRLSALIYPNPNNGLFTVHISQKVTSTIYISLFDNQGRLCFTDQVEPTRVFYVNASSNIESGIYTLQLRINSKTITQKLIIQ